MKSLKTIQILSNELTSQLYSSEDQRFVELVQSIEIHGILEPLVVRPIGENLGLEQFEIISGNRRLRAANELKIAEVPVIIKEIESVSREIIRAHQEQRVKTPSEIALELEELKVLYGLRQGVRSDIDDRAREGRLKKAEYVKKLGKSQVERLTQYVSLAKVMSSGDADVFKEYMIKLDKAKGVSTALKEVQRKVKERKNQLLGAVEPVSVVDKATIYNKSCVDLSDLEEGSVRCVITSPPYYKIRDFVLGDDDTAKNEQLGMENTPDEFIENLVDVLDNTKRVLTRDGSLFVNIFDTVRNGNMLGIPFKLVLKMVERGWILNDTIVWSKRNARPTNHKRTIATHEYIFHFVKTVQFYYDSSWIGKYKFDPHRLTLGGEGKVVKLRSDLIFDGATLETAANNNGALKSACEKVGVHMTHSATFPKEVPLVCILSTTKPDDVVLDIFSGTGTCGEVALETGRRYVGYEMNPSYIRASMVRLNAVRSGNTLDYAA
jgi:site-specific DNA-methyltransferase (adenine-specific)